MSRGRTQRISNQEVVRLFESGTVTNARELRDYLLENRYDYTDKENSISGIYKLIHRVEEAERRRRKDPNFTLITNKKYPGRPPYLSDEQVRDLLIAKKRAESVGGRITKEALAEMVREFFGVEYSEIGIYTRLRDMEKRLAEMKLLNDDQIRQVVIAKRKAEATGRRIKRDELAKMVKEIYNVDYTPKNLMARVRKMESQLQAGQD